MASSTDVLRRGKRSIEEHQTWSLSSRAHAMIGQRMCRGEARSVLIGQELCRMAMAGHRKRIIIAAATTPLRARSLSRRAVTAMAAVIATAIATTIAKATATAMATTDTSMPPSLPTLLHPPSQTLATGPAPPLAPVQDPMQRHPPRHPQRCRPRRLQLQKVGAAGSRCSSSVYFRAQAIYP